MSILRRPAAAGAFALTAVFALGACGTSFNAQTNQQYQAAEGANQRGDVNSMNTVIVVGEDGTGVVSAGLVNKTDDEQTLSEITVADADGQELEVSAPSEDVTIRSGAIVTLGSSEENVFSVEGAEAGDYVTVTLSFEDAAETEVNTPVVERSETYEEVAEPA